MSAEVPDVVVQVIANDEDYVRPVVGDYRGSPKHTQADACNK
jgi:hypothetical protein